MKHCRKCKAPNTGKVHHITIIQGLKSDEGGYLPTSSQAERKICFGENRSECHMKHMRTGRCARIQERASISALNSRELTSRHLQGNREILSENTAREE